MEVKTWQRVKKEVQSKKADSSILALVVFFIVVLLIAVVFQYTSTLYIANGVKDSLQRAVLNTITDNAYNSYDGFREGGSATVQSGSWEVTIDLSEVERHLINELGVVRGTDGSLESYAPSGNLRYKISGIYVNYDNETSFDADNPLMISMEASIDVPVQVLRYTMTLHIPVEVDARYSPKF